MKKVDKVIFKKDIALAVYPYTLYFVKDKEYEVLDEDKEYIFLDIKQIQINVLKFQRQMKVHCLNINYIHLEGDNTFEQYEETD